MDIVDSPEYQRIHIEDALYSIRGTVIRLLDILRCSSLSPSAAILNI